MMTRFPWLVCVLVLGAVWFASPAGAGDGDPVKGADAYRICYNCHSLEPGVHLTGPSLAGVWGRRAGTVEGFTRYSDAMSGAKLVWTAETLDAWFADPQKLIPGNTMVLDKVAHAGVRANLIAFLEVAMGPDGIAQVVQRGWLEKVAAQGRIPLDLSTVPDGKRVTAIAHCGDAWQVTLEDGRTRTFWERNLQFKTDTGPRGPGGEQGVLLETGSVGDRALVVFGSAPALSRAIRDVCP